MALASHAAEHARYLARAARQHCTNLQSKLAKTAPRLRVSRVKVPPKALWYTGLLIITCLWLLVALTRWIRNRRRSTSRPSTPNLEKPTPFKAPERAPGGNEAKIDHVLCLPSASLITRLRFSVYVYFH